MAAYIIGYDLNKEAANYSKKHKALTDKVIETFETRWKPVDSTWIVVSTLTAVQIRDLLKALLDSNDKLIVIRVANDGAWHGLTEAEGKWMVNTLKS